jgi:hypothetical protein
MKDINIGMRTIEHISVSHTNPLPECWAKAQHSFFMEFKHATFTSSNQQIGTRHE